MKHIRNLPVFLIVASFVLPATWAQRTGARAWPPAQGLNLKQVALFKNGLGFFVAETICPADQTDFRIILPVAPTHGTLWISYGPGVDLASAVAKEVEFTETLDAITIRELLEANQGRKVTLTVADEEIVGVITHVARNRETDPPDSYRPGGRARPTRNRELGDGNQANLVMVQTDSGLLCIDPRAVTRILFAEERIEQRFAHRIKKVELDMRLNHPASGEKVTLTFLAKGIAWAPSYMVDVTEEQQARVSAKAVIVNDACNLKNVAVQLVTGFPHLQFSDVVSPVAMKANLAQFLQALNQGESQRGRSPVTSNVMYQSVAYSGRAGGGMAPEYDTADAGVVAEDLFLYPTGQIDLDRDAVAYLPLFTESVPYEHIYQWDIPDYVNEQNRYNYGRDQRDGQDDEQEVWHSLRLTNTTKIPWTTAPGETVKGGIILGQDTLKYTPPGGKTTLRITRAIGVKADQVELETARKRDAVKWHGNTYDLVTIKGELSVLNTLGKPIKLEITKTLSGETKTIDPDAGQEKLAKGLRRVNSVVKLTWTIELPPAAEKKLSYVYEVYVR